MATTSPIPQALQQCHLATPPSKTKSHCSSFETGLAFGTHLQGTGFSGRDTIWSEAGPEKAEQWLPWSPVYQMFHLRGLFLRSRGHAGVRPGYVERLSEGMLVSSPSWAQAPVMWVKKIPDESSPQRLSHSQPTWVFKQRPRMLWSRDKPSPVCSAQNPDLQTPWPWEHGHYFYVTRFGECFVVQQ